MKATTMARLQAAKITPAEKLAREHREWMTGLAEPVLFSYLCEVLEFGGRIGLENRNSLPEPELQKLMDSLYHYAIGLWRGYQLNPGIAKQYKKLCNKQAEEEVMEGLYLLLSSRLELEG